MNVVLSYPNEQEELEVLRMVRTEDRKTIAVSVPSCSPDEIRQIQQEVRQVYVSDMAERYMVRLIQATRPETEIGKSGRWKELIVYGAGPRATLALDNCSRAVAWMSGRDYVTGDDIKRVAKDVLRHRIRLSLKAWHEGWDVDKVLDELLLQVKLG